MGRKIPGKKHRTVKDPEQQQIIRFESIKNKINVPPANPDNQEVSKSLEKFIKLKEKFKNKPKEKKKPRVKSNLITIDPKLRKKNQMYKSKNSSPAFNQKKGESTNAFLYRINKTVQEVIREVKYEDKYKVKIERDLKTGEVSNIVKKVKQKNKNKTQNDDKPKLTKSQKRKQKLDEKKVKKNLEKSYDVNTYQDEVQFGEVVHEPPNLTTPRKADKSNCAPRPGNKNLLLKNILNENKHTKSNNALNKKTVWQRIQNEGSINKKGKRKNLPQGVRRQLENHQNEIINIYRSIKQKKINKS